MNAAWLFQRRSHTLLVGILFGMSGARIAGSAALELGVRGGSLALAAMCIGVGQGIAVALERV